MFKNQIDFRPEAYLLAMNLTRQNTPVPAHLEETCMQALKYVCNCIDANMTFSDIILSSKNELGYRLGDRSFCMMMESIVNRKCVEPQKISALDDLQIFNADASNGLSLRWYENLQRNIGKISSAEKVIIPPESIQKSTLPKSENEPINETNMKESKNEPLNKETTLQETESEKRVIIDESSSSNSGSKVLNEPSPLLDSSPDSNSNNSTILIYTIIAFVSILTINWFVKKYYPDTVSKTPCEDETTNSYSVLEQSYDLLISLLLLVVPMSIIIFYNYRYYIKYQIKLIFKY